MARTKMQEPKKIMPAQKRKAISAKKPRTSNVVKKVRRTNKVLREIRECQARTTRFIPKAVFSRLIRQYSDEIRKGTRWGKREIDAVQEFTEEQISTLFENAYKIALENKRVTLMPKDLRIARSIMSLKK